MNSINFLQCNVVSFNLVRPRPIEPFSSLTAISLALTLFLIPGFGRSEEASKENNSVNTEAPAADEKADGEAEPFVPPSRDTHDLGLGIDAGGPFGLKLRYTWSGDSGLVLGADADAGTVFYVSDATISALLGYWLSNRVRVMLIAGVGTTAIMNGYAGPIAHVGAGIEWKPRKWFGFGAEGGYNLGLKYPKKPDDADLGTDADTWEPKLAGYIFGRITVTFYFI
jgi:hypothetical protein